MFMWPQILSLLRLQNSKMLADSKTEAVRSILVSLGKPSSALEISKQSGSAKLSRSAVNSILYRNLHFFSVTSFRGQRPLWDLCVLPEEVAKVHKERGEKKQEERNAKQKARKENKTKEKPMRTPDSVPAPRPQLVVKLTSGGGDESPWP